MATHLLNLLPSTSIQNDIPFFKLFQKSVSYSHIRVFGCLCYPHLSPPHKIEPQSTPCVFRSYPTNHRGFRCLDLTTRKIIISRHVTFDESVFPFQSLSPTPSTTYNFLDVSSDPSYISRRLLESPVVPDIITTPRTTGVFPNNPTASTTSPSHSTTSMASSSPHTASTPPLPPPPPSHPMITRGKHGISKPIQKLNLRISTPSPIPRSHIQALKDPHWRAAMQAEYDALIKNGTWVLEPRPRG